MLSFLRKYALIISVLLLLTLLVLVWLFPSSGLIPGIFLILLSFALAGLTIFEKHRQAYLEGKISRAVCTRYILFDVTGILLALVIAGLLGRYIAEMATEQISNDLAKLAAGIIVGLLIGLVVGILIKQLWGRFVKALPEN
jgi:uncharacterized protein YacL